MLTTTAQRSNKPSSDPRLAIPGYKSGTFELLTTSGDAKLWKFKARPAPYTIKPYLWDPTISVGSGPPTCVVITGFDPFTPESQIRALFSSYGDVAEVENRTDPNTGTFLGVCLVRYRDSRPSRGPSVPAAAAAQRAEKEGNKQRIGVSTVRVERDQGGRKCRRYVERLAQRNLERHTKNRVPEHDARNESVDISTPVPISAPPPNAPRGPSGKRPVRPVLDAPGSLATTRLSSLIEQESILSSIKRKPYIFIADKHVPVMPTTIPHLQKRLKMFHWDQVRCDQTGYFVVFEDSKRGEDETSRCYKDMNGQSLFTYVMDMECQQYGNPAYERTPSPERVVAETRRKEEEELVLKDEAADLEIEKKDRALNLDPVRAALEQLRIELKERVSGDVKCRIAVPALYDFLDPSKHVAKRRKLGIADPTEQHRPATFLTIPEDTSPSKGSLLKSSTSGNFRKSLLSARLGTRTPQNDSLRASDNVFADERRKRRPIRKPDAQPRNLHQRLLDLSVHEEESDDERQSFPRESLERDSTAMSRMSSVAPLGDRDDDPDTPSKKRRRLERETTPQDEGSGGEQAVLERIGLRKDLFSKEPEDMSIADLTTVIATLPPLNKLRKRAKAELRLRQTAKEDERLFKVESRKSEDGELIVVDDGVINDERVGDVIVTTEFSELLDSKLIKKKTKSKKKSKKQIFEEREAAKAEAQLQALEDEETIEEFDIAEETVKIELPLEEEEEPRAEVEWGLSTEAPRRTVDDDLEVILDIDGWQNVVKDGEDLHFLKIALADETSANLGDANNWAYRQKEIKALNSSGIHGVVRSKLGIQGYYIANSTGSARTQGIKKIPNAEKSKYLPHRIKVAKAREAREARGGAEVKTNSIADAEAARAAKAASTAMSRSTRVNNRTHIKDINTVKQTLATDGQQGDAIRFNQLKKRKKLVKFDRSAIHGWGLYAEENIGLGEMIIEYVGEKIRQAVANVREVRYTKQGMGSSYLFRIDEDSVVDATKKGGIARFINHSCAPNCTAKIIRVEGTKRIVIYALKDIAKSKIGHVLVLRLTLTCL